MADRVRMWRPASDGRILFMAGTTTRYAIEPRGDYVFGIVSGQPMKSRRGRERRIVRPGQLVAWDPSQPHAGAAIEGRPWTSRLMVIEGAGFADLAGDQEENPLANLAFPKPVITDADLSRKFLRLHASSEAPMTRLEQEELLAEWLRALVERSAAKPAPRAPLAAQDDLALRRACDYLGDQPARNVGLDELATAAEIGKFRLIRLFRERTGLPPHAFQLAHRVRLARRLLESGETVAATAASTGFADQSHLHRHFTRSLGLTPGEYVKRLRA